MIYVASPYSHPVASIREARYVAAAGFIASRWRAAPEPVFSPIVYAHRVAVDHDIPGDAAHWRTFNRHMIERCAGMYLLALAGWDQSAGVAMELAWRRELRLPLVVFIPDPHTDGGWRARTDLEGHALLIATEAPEGTR